jgi:hypothetical protein
VSFFHLKGAVYNLNKIFCLLLIFGTFEYTELCFRIQINEKRIAANIESLLYDRIGFWSNRLIIVIIVFYFIFINNLISAGAA